MVKPIYKLMKTKGGGIIPILKYNNTIQIETFVGCLTTLGVKKDWGI